MKQLPPPPNARYRHRKTLTDEPTRACLARGIWLLSLEGVEGFATPFDDTCEWYRFTPDGFSPYDDERTYRIRRCNVDWL